MQEANSNNLLNIVFQSLFKVPYLLVKNNLKNWRSLEVKFFRTSQRRCFIEKGVLKDFAKLSGKYLLHSPIFKVAGPSRELYQKRGSGTDVFS